MESKLDAPTRRLLAQVDAGEGLDDGAGDDAAPIVSVLVRTTGQPSGDQLDALRADGARLRTTAGDVLTLDCPVTALRKVAAHDFVAQVSASGPLFNDAGPAGSLSDVE